MCHRVGQAATQSELFMRHMDLKQTGFQTRILKYLYEALKLKIVL